MKDSILIVVNDFWRGGAEKNAKLLHESLEYEGLNVSYIHVGRYADPEHSIYSKILAFRIVKLIRYLNRNSPRVVISFSTEYGIILTLLKFFFSYKIIFRLLNNPHFTLKGAKKYLFYYSIRKADKVVCQSYKMSSDLITALKLLEMRMTVITNPVEIPVSLDTLFPRKDLLMVGKLEKQKRYDRAIDLIDLFREKKPDITLTIIGEGSQREELETLVKIKGLNQNIRFIGRIEKASNLMKDYKALWLTSDYEGYPNVILEALANNTPVISFDCDYGPAEIIENGISGFVIPLGNLSEFIAKTLEVFGWPLDKRNLVGASVKSKSNFDYINSFKQIICEFL